MFHRHKWAIVGRAYNPPTKLNIDRAKGRDALIVAERLLTGWTDVSLRCECGDVASRQVLGWWKDEGAAS